MRSVAGALDTRPCCTAMVGSIRSLRSPRSRAERAIFVRAREPAVADDVGHQNGGESCGVSVMARPQAVQT